MFLVKRDMLEPQILIDATILNPNICLSDQNLVKQERVALQERKESSFYKKWQASDNKYQIFDANNYIYLITNYIIFYFT